MNIYEALKKDHRKLRKMLDQLASTSKGDDRSWKLLLDQIRDQLIPHSRAEEAVFYNSIRESGQALARVADSYREHAMAETELRALEGMKRMDVNWTSAVEKLCRDVKDHIEKEEKETFASAREIFDEEEARQIGSAFEKLKPEVRMDATSFAGNTIDMISSMLPRRLVDTFRRVASGAAEEKKAA